ncbi:MAG: hypothetical protein HRS50_01605, partial [Mycoplasmataceae bacterium]|nr:hypothetical protein [Mycoplasmataceae bacterium]
MKNIQKFHTDTNYLSQKEIKHTKNIEYSEKLWQEVLDYREKFSFDLPLLLKKNSYVRLTQTPWILQKEIKMISDFSIIQQKMLTNISTKYSSETLLEDIETKYIVYDIHWMLNSKSKKNIISRIVIDNIVNNNEEPSNEEKKIMDIYENIIFISNKKVSPREIAKLFYKKTDFDSKLLDDIHASLISSLKSNKINSLLTKASLIIF